MRPQGGARRRRPERLYLQHHGGIYRSDDGGGVVDGDDGHRRHGLRLPGRRPPDPTRRRPTCCRSRATSTAARRTAIAWCGGPPTRGESWEPLTNGLPQRDAHLTVLRDGFTTDGQDPAGLYFGTRTGEVYGSIDDGESWRLLADHLPPVMSVRAAPVG